MSVRAVYKTKDDFESDVTNGRFYEGFVIGIGYAYVHIVYQMPGNLNGFGRFTNDYPEDNRFSGCRLQKLDTSQEMVELSLRGHTSGEFMDFLVMRDDTLWAISRELGVTVEDLVRWNNIANPNKIYAGQILLVDVNKAKPRTLPSKIGNNTRGLSSVTAIIRNDGRTRSGGANRPLSGREVSPVGLLDKVIVGMGLSGTFIQQSNLSFYINSLNEIVTFRGGGPPNATSVSNIGRNIGRGALGISIALDYVKYRNDEITGERFTLNTSLNATAYYNPAFGIPYGLTELFYPGGFIQAMSDRADLEAERRKAMGRMYLPLCVKSYN